MSTVFVMGASRGIGLELVRQYRDAGERVIATARDAYPGARLVALDPGWVQTDMGGTQAPLSLESSVQGLRTTLASVCDADNGRLLHHDGRRAEHW